MLAYAEYFNDARIKGYVNSLIKWGYSVDIFCLYDKYSLNKKEENVFIKSLGKKYQGENKVLYLFSYFLFLIKAFFYLSFYNFKKK